MNSFETIRRTVPFLKHLTAEESEFFFRTGSVITVKSGQYAELKKTSSLNIVISGIFEVETIGNAEVVFFTSGSFFGSLPFVENRKRGNVRALLDSTIFVIQEEDILRFFMKYHKALRGYIRMITSMGFEMTETGRRYFDLKGKVISVFSSSQGTGKTTLAAALGLALAMDETVILDISYTGKSLFDVFQRRLTAPVSERDQSATGAESLLNDRLVHVRDGLYLLNITYSSRLRIDPSIIGTLLFLLSRRFRYIIADLSNTDPELRDAVFAGSDMIFALTGGKKETGELNDLFDEKLKDFQRVFFVRNEYLPGERGAFVGGFTFEHNREYEQSGNVDLLAGSAAGAGIKPFVEKITSPGRSLAVQSLSLESVCLAGFFVKLQHSGKFFDTIYSSSFSYFISCLYLLGHDEKELTGMLRRFYSSEQINRNLDISFPESFIFKNSRILRYARELASDKRVEMFHTQPVCKFISSGSERIASTGDIAALMAASYITSPLFEPVSTAGGKCSSGYPAVTVSPAELFRTGCDEIYYLSVLNRGRITLDDGVINKLYKNTLDTGTAPYLDESYYIQQGKNLFIEIDENEFKFDKISEKTKAITHSLLLKIP